MADSIEMASLVAVPPLQVWAACAARRGRLDSSGYCVRGASETELSAGENTGMAYSDNGMSLAAPSAGRSLRIRHQPTFDPQPQPQPPPPPPAHRRCRHFRPRHSCSHRLAGAATTPYSPIPSRRPAP